MKIDVSELRKVKGRSEKFLGMLPDHSLDVLGQKSTFRSLKVDGEATNTGEGIFVRGNVTGYVDFACSLCLKEFSVSLNVPLEENYHREGEEIPQDEEEPVRVYREDEIDITDLIKEGLLLALPMKPICKPDCKGLCSYCGCDLNTQQCNCKEEEIDPRLAVLGSLLQDLDKNPK